MAAAVKSHISLAQTLDPRLLRFFTRFPPAQIVNTSQPPPIPSPETISITSNTSPMDPNAATPTEITLADASKLSKTTSSSGDTTLSTTPPSPLTPTFRKHNPFLPHLNPSTGNWHSPHYSLRRQAVLYKLAQEHDVLSLMPIAPKHPVVKAQRRLDLGLRVRGTGVGQKVKGKLWERTLRGKQETRRRAMEGMAEMVREWKQRGHGRGWKKWPK